MEYIVTIAIRTVTNALDQETAFEYGKLLAKELADEITSGDNRIPFHVFETECISVELDKE